MLSIIVAFNKNRVIGRNNTLPWRLREDLKRFKQLTMGKVVIMGANTFKSLNYKALPGRTNIVLSVNLKQEDHPDVTIYTNLLDALVHHSLDEVFIIGGYKLYLESLHLVSKLYITEVDENSREPNDVLFPHITDKEFFKVEGSDIYTVVDEHNQFPTHYYELTRR